MLKFYVMLQVLLANISKLGTVNRTSRVKAAGLLEYALVALISVGIFAAIGFIFRNQFTALVDRIFSGI